MYEMSDWTFLCLYHVYLFQRIAKADGQVKTTRSLRHVRDTGRGSGAKDGPSTSTAVPSRSTRSGPATVDRPVVSSCTYSYAGSSHQAGAYAKHEANTTDTAGVQMYLRPLNHGSSLRFQLLSVPRD